MQSRHFIVATRLFFGALAIVALIAQIFRLIHLHTFSAVNLFSYFTNLSNMFAAFVLIISALYVIKNRKPSLVNDLVRCAAVLYMTVTGVVYALLLSGNDLGALLPWVNIVLHYVMPVVVIADWLYQPQLAKLKFKQTLWWLVFPLFYLVYALVRGHAQGWYPYPFLNPAKVGGYAEVAVYCIAILVAFLCLSWAIRKLGNTIKRRIS